MTPFLRPRSPDCPPEQLELIRVLGNGVSGEVRLAKDTSGRLFAVKFFVERKNNLFVNELSTLQIVSPHPHIVHLFSALNTPMRLVLEYGGDLRLYDRIYSKVSERLMSFVEMQIVVGHLGSALTHCHSLHVIHGDLKAENVLVTKANHDIVAKLCDWGSATYNPHDIAVSVYPGTPVYMSPEQLRDENASYEVDTWALAVLLYEMMYRREPFPTIDFGMVPLYSAVVYTGLPFDDCVRGVLRENLDDRTNMAAFIDSVASGGV